MRSHKLSPPLISVGLRNVISRSNRYEQIKELFFAGQLTWSEALNRVARLPKPWATAEWAKKRESLIREACEKCGSARGPLVLQHLWQPPTFRELCEIAKRVLQAEYEKQHPYAPPEATPFDPTQIPPRPAQQRDACPRCGSVNIRFNKKTALWHCNYVGHYLGSHRRGICGEVFEQPEKIQYSRWTEIEWLERARHRHEEYPVWHRQQWEWNFTKEWYDRIGAEATKLSFLANERYMAMAPGDVATYCKRCAFLEDVQNSPKLAARYPDLWFALFEERLHQKD